MPEQFTLVQMFCLELKDRQLFHVSNVAKVGINGFYSSQKVTSSAA